MKYFILVFLNFFLAFQSLAEGELDCAENSDQITELSTEIQTASKALIKKCPSKDEVILKNVTVEYQNKFGKLPKTTATIGGLSLQGSEKEIEIAKLCLGKKPPKDWMALAKGCTSILCAFEKNLKSKEAAMQIFNIASKSGYVLILDQSINQGKANQLWSPSEIREMDAAVSKLPKELKNLEHLKKIERMADNYRLHSHNENVAAFATSYIFMVEDAKIVMYDTGLKDKASSLSPYDTKSWPQEVLIHELCHHHDFKGDYDSLFSTVDYSEDEEKGFSALSGWEKTVDANGADKWIYSNKAQFISSYAKTNPHEDYAETCMNYILNPHELEKKVPSKYSYMKKNVFNGAEFKSKPWNSDEITWPKLKNLLANESNCSSIIANCLNAFIYKDHHLLIPTIVVESSNSTSTTYIQGSPERNIKSNECIKKMRTDKVAQFTKTLSLETDYCEQGGDYGIQRQKDKICGKSETMLAQLMNKAASDNLSTLISECQSIKNYQDSCITNLFYKGFPKPVPEEYKKLVNRILNVRIGEAKKQKKK